MSIQRQLQAAITAQSLPPPSQALLASLTTRNPPPPLPSLLASARARLLASDLTSADTVDTSALAVLPPPPPGRGEEDYLAVPEVKIPADVYVQVLDVENLSLSRWEQIEQLELVEKGETTRGREVIRVTAEDDDEQDVATQSTVSRTQQQQQQRGGPGGPNAAAARAGKNATHRLTVQDYKGRRLHALELRRIDGIGIGKTNIGEKILIKAGTAIARGNVLLTPDSCTLLGGKVDAWHKAWVEGRLGRLKEAVGAQ